MKTVSSKAGLHGKEIIKLCTLEVGTPPICTVKTQRSIYNWKKRKTDFQFCLTQCYCCLVLAGFFFLETFDK